MQYDAGAARPVQPPSQGTKYGLRPPSQTITGDPRGAWAAAKPENRPSPFQVGPARTPWGQSNNPFQERWKFVQNIQQQNMQRQQQFNTGGRGRPATWGQRPTIDYAQAFRAVQG